MATPLEHPIFQINRIVYWLINIFVLLGLFYGIYADLFVVRSVFAVNLSNFGSLVVLLIGLTLVRLGKIPRNHQIELVHFVVVWNVALSTVIDSSNGMLADVLFTGIVIGMAMTGSSAFLCRKPVTLILGFVTYALLTFVTISGGSPFLHIWYPLSAIVILGHVVVMYYYRSLVEDMSHRLEHSKFALEHTNKDLRRMRHRAEMINLQNKPFVIFGKNTAGLIHDFKNDLALLTATKSVVEMKIQRSMAIQPEDLAGLSRGIEKLSERIDRVLYVTSAREDSTPEVLNLAEIMDRSMYPFQLTPEVRAGVRFTLNVQDQHVVILGNRYTFLQVAENLLRNSCEAILDHSVSGSVEISIFSQENQGVIDIIDTGPGISFCFDCDEPNCMDCGVFAIGKTTKAQGSGFGMRNVISGVKELSGSMFIRSKEGEGTSIRLSFPLHRN
ncbi:MAG: HAMP domain-containing histidine kinase [Spirochaetales bacterium]|nr:HAMP domain-containing histidine kinase [Spirochaetales bacterium]